MNKKQRYVIFIGCIIVAVMTLFPPYQGVEIRKGDNLTAFAGYRCIFVPPSAYVICKGLYGKDRAERWVGHNAGDTFVEEFTSHIDAQRLAAQMVAVVLITCGLAFVSSRGQALNIKFRIRRCAFCHYLPRDLCYIISQSPVTENSQT